MKRGYRYSVVDYLVIGVQGGELVRFYLEYRGDYLRIGLVIKLLILFCIWIICKT